MKLIVMGDSHFGVRGDNLGLHDYFEKFYSKWFFPILEERKISTIIHLGDVFDRRKYINFQTLQRCKEYFFEPLKERNIKLYLIVGNHDITFKNTNDLNSLNLLLKEYNNIVIYKDASEIELDNTKILLVPWISPETFRDSFKKINETKAHILFGHLEIAGFQMYKDSIFAEGFDKDLFSGFELVVSGHFHHRSRIDNIQYNGAIGEYTWSDYNDERGFHIFDTKDHSLEYIVNPFKLFHKIYYNDSIGISILDGDFAQYKNCYVKIVIQNKTNPYWFDLFIEKLENVGVLKLDIIEEKMDLDTFNNEIIDETQSTIEILNGYVDKLDLKVNKKRIKDELFNLYHDALEL